MPTKPPLITNQVNINQAGHPKHTNNSYPTIATQHGFRQQRSTMTAHAHMQKDWIINKEEGQKTGILIWDLSAAFDTLDIDLITC